MTIVVDPPTGDPLNPGILQTAGSELIYPQATGLEKAWADTEGQRLIAIYAELVSDQWDPNAISSRNLPWLAWAMGVNLWESDWSDDFKRWWVANQWYLKSIRGSLLGTETFVNAVGGKVIRAIRPPAITFPGPSYTDAERAAYNARFPQLRVYPYYPRQTLPWLCFTGPFYSNLDGHKVSEKNGSFLGPIQKCFPTNSDRGGLYTRYSTEYFNGVETPLTFRTVVDEDVSTDKVTTYDEVGLPGHIGDKYFLDQPQKFLTSNIFLGRLDPTEDSLIRIPRDGSLVLSEYQAQYVTISPGLGLIDVNPNHISQAHPIRPTEIYTARGQFLTKGRKFLPPSNAYLYFYEQWFLYDPEVVPAYKKASVFLGQTRLGIPNYTAELKVAMFKTWPRCLIQSNGFLRGFLPAPNTDSVDKLRRAVKASKALRDTIHLDTAVMRVVEVNDAVLTDGSHYVGEMIQI